MRLTDSRKSDLIERGKRMSKVKKEVLVDAKESHTEKKVRAPKKAKVALGPTELGKAKKAAAKPHRSRSEAAKAAWANHRDTITAGINRFFAQKKAAAGKVKPKAKAAAQPQPQA